MRFGVALALAVCTGCAPATGELWLFQIGTIEESCQTSIDENFIDANVSEEAAPDEDWTYTSDFELSDRLVVGTVLHGRAGSRALILDGVVYPGVEEKGALTFTWESSTDSEVMEEHDAGYRYVASNVTTSTATISLEKDPETKGQTGTIDISNVAALNWVEDDEWAFEAVGLSGGQIPAFLYLEGPGVVNDPTQEDCTGVTCALTVSDNCTGSASVQATYLGRTDNSGFGELEGAEMPYGAIGSVGSTTY